MSGLQAAVTALQQQQSVFFDCEFIPTFGMLRKRKVGVLTLATPKQVL